MLLLKESYLGIELELNDVASTGKNGAGIVDQLIVGPNSHYVC